MTDGQMASELGGAFTGQMTDVELWQLMESLPEGMVGVISAENPKPDPSGPEGSWERLTGHFFAGAKALVDPVFLDGQQGKLTPPLPANWRYRWMPVNNALK